MGRIKITFAYIDADIFLGLFKTLVRLHMEYGIQAWSPFLQNDMDTLEKVQRKVNKLAPALRKHSYDERLETLGLTTVEARKVREGHA